MTHPPSDATLAALASPAAELLTWVDEQNQVLGAQRRDVVHREGLYHRAVHVLVLWQGSFVFQQRSQHKAEFPLHWECVGGHVDAGEADHETAAREVREELGASPVAVHRLAAHGGGPVTGREFVTVWRAELDRAPAPAALEVAAIQLVSLSEISRWTAAIQASAEVAWDRPISPSFIETLRHLPADWATVHAGPLTA